MANYPVPANPVYNNAIRQIENTDPAQADTILNPVIEQLIENDEALSKTKADKTELTAATTKYEATTTGTASMFAVSFASTPVIYAGLQFRVKWHAAPADSATLTINNPSGAVLATGPIYMPNGDYVAAGDIAAGAYSVLVYSGSGFFVLGGSGSPKLTGNAAAADVLTGKTFYNTDAKTKVTGALVLTGTAAATDVINGKTFYNTDAKTKNTGSLALTGDAAAGDVFAGKTYYSTDPKAKQTGAFTFAGDAAAGDVISGKTFYGNTSTRQTGSLALTGNAPVSAVMNGYTFYNTDAKTKVTGSLSLTGNALPSDVLSGKTFYNTGATSKQTGTMTPSLMKRYSWSGGMGSLAPSSSFTVNCGFRAVCIGFFAQDYYIYGSGNSSTHYFAIGVFYMNGLSTVTPSGYAPYSLTISDTSFLCIIPSGYLAERPLTIYAYGN